MSPIEQVRLLQKQINAYNREIARIQRKCPHKRIRHKLFPDIYCGQGRSSQCLDCGKSMGCSTMTMGIVENRVIKKTWVEHK